jgi:NAD(P)H-dependent flavin oxidoreductase YrpB (nitropropane dioxygenase family)
MWYNTPVSKLLGIEYPVLLGPFGGDLSSVKLAALVSNMGGVGGYGAYTLTPDEIVRLNQDLKQATDRPYGGHRPSFLAPAEASLPVLLSWCSRSGSGSGRR